MTQGMQYLLYHPHSVAVSTPCRVLRAIRNIRGPGRLEDYDHGESYGTASINVSVACEPKIVGVALL
jgi:hypothetical protein